MKKIFTLVAFFVGCVIVAKAQTNNNKSLKTDTIKTFEDLSKYLKQRSYVTPSVILPLDSPAFAYKGIQKNPFSLNNNTTKFITKEIIAENMPVVKLHSADNMPVLKLGDTDKMHFTMLVKPLESSSDKSKAVTP